MAINLVYREELNIINKNKKDIINDINYDNEDDVILCDAIIDSLENYIAEKIKEDKCVQLPHLGTLRKNIVKSKFNEESSELKGLRQTVNKEEYRKIIKNKARKIILDLKEKEKNKKIYDNIIKIYKKKYEEYYKLIGPAFADMWIYSKTIFEPIEFDAEVQRQFDELSKNEK